MKFGWFLVTTYESSPDDLQKILGEEAKHGPSTKITDISVSGSCNLF